MQHASGQRDTAFQLTRRHNLPTDEEPWLSNWQVDMASQLKRRHMAFKLTRRYGLPSEEEKHGLPTNEETWPSNWQVDMTFQMTRRHGLPTDKERWPSNWQVDMAFQLTSRNMVFQLNRRHGLQTWRRVMAFKLTKRHDFPITHSTLRAKTTWKRVIFPGVNSHELKHLQIGTTYKTFGAKDKMKRKRYTGIRAKVSFCIPQFHKIPLRDTTRKHETGHELGVCERATVQWSLLGRIVIISPALTS
jgi:hypothetical protein